MGCIASLEVLVEAVRIMEGIFNLSIRTNKYVTIPHGSRGAASFLREAESRKDTREPSAGSHWKTFCLQKPLEPSYHVLTGGFPQVW